MSPQVFIVGSIILAASIFMVKKGRKETIALEKYEIENRGPDGLVNFDSIESSRTHTANKGLYKVITIVGWFVGLFGIIILGTGLNL